jgi:hypothetical protein
MLVLSIRMLGTVHFCLVGGFIFIFIIPRFKRFFMDIRGLKTTAGRATN